MYSFPTQNSAICFFIVHSSTVKSLFKVYLGSSGFNTKLKFFKWRKFDTRVIDLGPLKLNVKWEKTLKLRNVKWSYTVYVNPLKSIYFNVWYSTGSDLFCLNFKTVVLCPTVAGNKSDRESPLSILFEHLHNHQGQYKLIVFNFMVVRLTDWHWMGMDVN
jgi:hypothetical protein